MTDTNDSEDVAKFEELFKDRFTENDVAFMELKSKALSPPAVIYPWKIAQKQLNKKWDYSSRRQDQESYRNHDRQRYSRGDNHNPTRDGECSNYRSRSYDSHRDNYRERSYHRDRNRNHSEREQGSHRNRERY